MSSPVTVATVNVNGIRAAAKHRNERNHGILPWLEETPADVVLLQEVRATPEQTRQALAPALDPDDGAGWTLVQAEAAAKGRAGVAVLSRHGIDDVRVGFGEEEFDDAGRYIEAVTAGVRVASLYLPSGAAGTEKQDEKYRFLEAFGPYLRDRSRECAAAGEGMVVGGDWNICHRREDLRNWRPNRTKAGFLPDERAFMDWLVGPGPDGTTQIGDETDAGRTGNPAGAPGAFAGAVGDTPGDRAAARLADGPATDAGWVDVVRALHPDEEGPFSWWTWRGKAFDTGAGWRIDYQMATPDLAARAQRAWVDRAEAYDLRWSDHSPVLVEYR